MTRFTSLINDLKLVIFFEIYWTFQILTGVERRLRGDL